MGCKGSDCWEVDADGWSRVSGADGTSIDIDMGSDSPCGAGPSDACWSWPGDGDGDGESDVRGVSDSDSGEEWMEDGWRGEVGGEVEIG